MLEAQEGQALGLSHYLLDDAMVHDKAMELARRMAQNAPLSNYAILNAVARIENMSMAEGLFTESLMAAVVHTGPEARRGLEDFLQRRTPRVALDSSAADRERGARG